jgi:hypothetical protein
LSGSSPRKRIALVAGYVIACVAVAVWWAHPPEFKNDPAVTAMLHHDLAAESWVSQIVAARWNDSQTLSVEVDTAAQATVMTICRDLTSFITRHTRSPQVGEIFIYETSLDLLATNFLDQANKCYWRQGAP